MRAGVIKVLVCLALLAPGAAAQAPVDARPELVALVPEEFALCLSLRDLRGEHERLRKSTWLHALRESALGRALSAAPEARQLRRLEQELKKSFDLDWPTLRDDILGDELVLAYRPAAPTKGEEEQGIVLLWARRPELVARLIDRLHALQTRSGELRTLETREYKGKTYHRRHDRGKDLYYCLDGSLLAAAGKEETLRGILDRRLQPAPSAWAQRFRRAGAERALLALGVQPRGLDLSGAKAVGALEFVPSLDALFVTVRAGAALEARLSVQANPENLPAWLRPAFESAPPPSALWQRFPERAVVTLAAQTDFAQALTAILAMAPPGQRVLLIESAQRSLGAVTGLDFVKDILPNVGPDWGLCLLPAPDPRQLPRLLAALAVQPGHTSPAVDQGLYRAVNLFAGLVVLDYNKNHPDALRLQTVLQEKVEVRYLQSDKLFPAGFQPACALKDGYLLFATAPDAIAQFGPAAAPLPAGETPLVRISPRGLATLLRERRAPAVAKLMQKHHLAAAEAEQRLTSLVETLDLFECVTLSRRATAGQADWVLRIQPASPR